MIDTSSIYCHNKPNFYSMQFLVSYETSLNYTLAIKNYPCLSLDVLIGVIQKIRHADFERF